MEGPFWSQGRTDSVQLEPHHRHERGNPISGFVQASTQLTDYSLQQASVPTARRGGFHPGCGCAVGEQGEKVHIQPITGT